MANTAQIIGENFDPCDRGKIPSLRMGLKKRLRGQQQGLVPNEGVESLTVRFIFYPQAF
jgi:hypothetical protein